MKRIIQIALFLILPGLFLSQNTGLQFDGIGDYVQTGFNGISDSSSRTVQCWYKGSSSGSQRFFVDMGVTSGGNGARFSLKINPTFSTKARIEIGGGGLDGTTSITNFVWHQITVVYDHSATTNKYKLYVDGVLDAQGDINIPLNTPATSANPMTIGIRTDLSTATDLSGSLDEVRVWNIPLTAAQITANWNKEICGIPTGLVAYYRMNEGIAGGSNTSISSLVDAISPASVNTLVGFNKTGATSNYTAHPLGGGPSATSISPSFCSGSYTTPSGRVITSAGTHYDTLPAANGCDSILTITLSSIGGISSVSASSCFSYNWQSNGMIYNTSGTYYDTITSPGNCDSIVTLNLTINSSNAGTISQSFGVLTASGSGTNYQWLDCGNGNSIITSATSQSYLPTANGSYACEITTSNGCKDTTACFSYSSTSIKTISNELTWSAYPNPATGSVFINLPEVNKSARLKIIDTQGKLVKEVSINESTVKVDVSELSNGMYQMILISDDKSSSRSIVINN